MAVRQRSESGLQLHSAFAWQVANVMYGEQRELSSHTRPCGQAPPQLVSQTHSPQVGDTVLPSHVSPGAQA